MKKLCLILAAVLLLTALAPSAAAETSTYTNQIESAEGYILKLKQPEEGTVSLLADIGLSEISEEAGLYKADSLSEIKALGDKVEYYEPDYTVTLADLPNDTYASKQWSLDSLDVTEAWDDGFNGAGVKIAVIDSGVNSMHEDFEDTNFAAGINMLDGSRDVSDVSDKGHGTFVCGLLAATRDNATGIAGLCTDATIVPIKCFGKGTETSASVIISAIYEAVDVFDCDVINMSLGMEENMASMEAAVEYATQKGAIIVSAVGNSGNSVLNYPAAYDCVVGVGAVDQNGMVASFSQTNSSVFAVAPGVKIVSLSNKGNSEYASGDGTSFSTPFVSVAAAILKQYAENATVEDFKTILKASLIDEGPIGYDTSYGYGSLNISNFVTVMKKYTVGGSGSIFSDIVGHWAEESIAFCVDRKLFTGVTTSSFEPETVMNRAMFVTVLSRLSGETITGYTNSFSDVSSSAWYAQPSAWGATKGIVSGTGAATFSPLVSVTREQMAVLLYRYAIYYGLTDGSADTALFTSYTDGSKVSSWAAEAMAWAVGNGLITGRTGNLLSPQDSAKRCEVATILTRFINKYSA